MEESMSKPVTQTGGQDQAKSNNKLGRDLCENEKDCAGEPTKLIFLGNGTR